ncbi:MAG: hypothetical protein RI926_1315 [Actinomycetota bacterium]|jgi:hypothetical protein
MKKKFNTRKGIILLAQIVAALSVVSMIVLSQIGAFAGADKPKPVSSSEPQEVTPTILTATKTPEEVAPAEEAAPPVEEDPNGGNPSFKGNTPAYLACKATMEQAQSVGNQSNQLWNQVSELRNSASNSTDPAEIENFRSQADALQLEANRLAELSNQLWQQLLQGHGGFSCGPDGPVHNW